jgi:hypothetical protein
MVIENQSGESSKSILTPERAAFLGHLFVTLPVIGITGLGCLLGYSLRGPIWGGAGLMLA